MRAGGDRRHQRPCHLIPHQNSLPILTPCRATLACQLSETVHTPKQVEQIDLNSPFSFVFHCFGRKKNKFCPVPNSIVLS